MCEKKIKKRKADYQWQKQKTPNKEKSHKHSGNIEKIIIKREITLSEDTCSWFLMSIVTAFSESKSGTVTVIMLSFFLREKINERKTREQTRTTSIRRDICICVHNLSVPVLGKSRIKKTSKGLYLFGMEKKNYPTLYILKTKSQGSQYCILHYFENQQRFTIDCNFKMNNE